MTVMTKAFKMILTSGLFSISVCIRRAVFFQSFIHMASIYSSLVTFVVPSFFPTNFLSKSVGFCAFQRLRTHWVCPSGAIINSRCGPTLLFEMVTQAGSFPTPAEETSGFFIQDPFAKSGSVLYIQFWWWMNAEQMHQRFQLICSERTFGQYVCQLFCGAHISHGKKTVQIDSSEWPVQVNKQSSSHMPQFFGLRPFMIMRVTASLSCKVWLGVHSLSRCLELDQKHQKTLPQ